MDIELTEQQSHALEAEENKPVRVIDPRTKESFVLLPAQAYERLKNRPDDDFDPREAYPWVDKVMAADDAGDPGLESY
jgi:hypothetical protein